jgi:hypothetical protein
MSMQDIMKALMQSSAGASQPSGGADALSQAIGGLMGGSQQSSGGGLGALLGSLLGGGQQGTPATQLLGGLQQVIGGQPGWGNLPMGGGTLPSANDPIMMLLQPVVNQVAAKANIPPQIAVVVASIAVHYLLQSHPSTPGASPLNLGNVMQQLASGSGIPPSTLQSSGIVNDVMQTTGLNQQQATKTLNTTFSVLGKSVKGKGVAGKATLKKTAKKK